MNNTYSAVKEYLYNDKIDINERLGSFFVYIGIIAAFFGVLIGFMAHLPVRGIMTIGSIALGAPLVAVITKHTNHTNRFGSIIAIGITLLIPAVWITSGGSTGGTTLWFLYELFYIALFAGRRRMVHYLVPAIILQAGCFVLEAVCPQYVYRITDMHDAAISLIGSLIVITSEICITVVVQKRMYQHERDINDKSEDFTRNFITSIANTIDTKDNYTGGHSRRVAVCASAIARRMGMSEQEVENVNTVALLHDIGKIGVPDRVLNKPGKLTEEEFALIRNHPIYGAEIVKDISMIPHVKEGVLYHHERYDGKGYPERLKGEEIPLVARIIAVADSYDAMSTNRIYRKFIKRQEIISDFINCRGTQFDPYIADVFVKMLMDGFVVEDEGSISLANAEKNLSVAAGNMLRRIAESDRKERVGAMNVDSEEFSQIYGYIRSLGRRYGDELLLLTIGLDPKKSGDMTQEDTLACMADLNRAITLDIRSVDICTRYSATSYLVLLLNAPPTAVDQIMDRISGNFNRLQGKATGMLTCHVIRDVAELL